MESRLEDAAQPLKVRELIGERVRGLGEYAPEPLTEIARRLDLPVGQIIKLDANENPYGPTRSALAALACFTAYHRYPDALSRDLRGAIGQYVGVDPESILVGNGSDEIIDLVLRLFRPGPDGGGIAQMINCPPTFGMYRFYGLANDLEVIECPRDADFRVNVAEIEALCWADPQPRILFLASPNNPDGQTLSDRALFHLLALPLVVVLDEAYVEFSQGSKVALVEELDNLIVLRTLSKWAGLAGLRVGYGVFPQFLMSALHRLKPPFNVNVAAQAAALATLREVSEAQETVAKIVAERQRLVEKLRGISFLEVFNSRTNYVLCRVRDMPVQAVRQAMEQRGIILRYFEGGGLEDCVRISVGTPTQSASLLMVLRELENRGGGDGRGTPG